MFGLDLCKHIICFVALLAAQCLFVPAGHAEERELAGQTTTIDVVLLIDSSGSMLSTDPLKLRYEGAKLLLQFLGKDDRLAIVSFAENAKTIRELSPFDPDQVDQISKTIEGISNDGRFTDLLEAVKSGKSILESNPREKAQRVMVLLSDGKMEPDPAVALPLARTQDLVGNYLPELKAKEIKVHTLAFSEQADRALLSEIAGASDGLSWFTLSPNEIHKSFADLFLAVKRPQVVPLTSRGFRIDEDVKEATFYVVHDEGATLSLTDPEGAEISPEKKPETIQWFSGQQFDVITLEEPAAGDWQVHGVSSNDGFATVLTNLKLVTEWPTTVRSDEPVIVQARLYESEKPVALPGMSGVIKYAFQISPTDKVSEPIVRETLTDSGADGDAVEKDGIFSRMVTLHEPGEYKLTVVARGPTFQRTQQVPFRVRPRLITLTVEGAEEGHSDGHGEEHAAEHGAEQGGEHSASTEHGESSEQKGEGHEDSPSPEAHSSGPKAAEGRGSIIKGDGRFTFKVEVSSEVTSFKKFEVKLTARNAERKRFELPLKRSIEEPTVYLFPAAGLPADGQYLLEAKLEGETKKKQVVEAESRPLKFERKSSGQESNVSVKVLVEGEHAEPPSNPFPFIQLLAVIVINCLVGGFNFMKVRSGQKSAGPSAVAYQVPDELSDFIRDLEARAAMTDVDVDDPVYSEADDAAPIPDAPTTTETDSSSEE